MSLHAHKVDCTRGGLDLFAGVTFTVSPGEALQVAGRNGSGKSSLLRILCGLSAPSCGEVRWEGELIQHRREQYHEDLTYIGHASGIKDELLAWENVAIAGSLAGIRIGMQAAYNALDQVGLSHIADLPARALSQGQRKRLALARLSLEMPRKLWVLDEPFTALDNDAVKELCITIDRHLDHGGMLVYTTHQDIVVNARNHMRLDLEERHPCCR